MKRWMPVLMGWCALIGSYAQAAPVLVDTEWLASRTGDSGVVVVDMTGDPMQYQRFHLPGAVHLRYDALVQRRRDGVALRIEDAQLLRLLGELGIRRDHHVVIYDDTGGLNAGRLFWELERIGHAAVSVLDGGLVKWILEGRKVENRWVRPTPQQYQPVAGQGRDNDIAHEALKTVAAEGKAALLDVRTREEYSGDPRDPRGGHIPGARWWPWDATVAFDGRFERLEAASLQESLRALGVSDSAQPVVLYCRTGHRAAQAYLTLRSLGYENLKLYDGSMLEYARDTTAPLQRGMTAGSPGCVSC